ncbi:MAG: DUF1801 domain-containing protein [Sphingobacteriia bacterium]|nr:DUF1801 domain-containing protein [Sphingobacteriia bacterium]
MPESQRNVLKTKVHDADVLAFIESFASTDQKRQDSPKMWGASMIGFGAYHYKSEKSRQEGDWFLVGFSPRKAAISLYVYTGSPEHAALLEGLGKFKAAKACLYIQKLADIDQAVLTKLMKTTIAFLQSKYPS